MSEIRDLVERLVALGVDAPEAAEIVTRSALYGASLVSTAQPEVREPQGRTSSSFDAKAWNRLRHRVFERDNYRCVYCGTDVTDKPQCDHVIPLIQGGSSAIDNLATACKRCNSSKAGRRPEEWRPSWQ